MLGKIGRRFSLQAPPEKSTWGPLLVCIAPHCSGRTSFIKGIGEKVYEINTEDVKGLYESVALSSIWNLWAEAQSPSKLNSVNSRLIYNLSLHDRIMSLKSTELYFVVMLFSKQMKLDVFRTNVLSVIDRSVPETAVEIYLKTVEELLHTEGTRMTTASIDLFVAEAVPESRNASLTDLKKAIKTEASVLCWSSNTLASNEPSAFLDILTIAAKYQRVVRFIRWGQELPIISFAEIVKRNLLKFLRTGRLIPLGDLYKSYRQCDETFKAGQLNHVDLSRMAGFSMDDMGRISEIVPNGNSPRRPSAIDATPWSKWSNTNVIQSSYNQSSGSGGTKTIERKSSINAMIEKLQNESRSKSSSPTESGSSKSAVGFLSPSNSLKGRLNSVSELVDSVESRRNSARATPVLTQTQQDEVDRKAALELDWKRAVEEAQRSAEKARLERLEKKKSEELMAVVNSRKNSMQSIDEQLRIEAELKLCEDMDEKVNGANRGRVVVSSPMSASGDSQFSTTTADLDTTYTPSVVGIRTSVTIVGTAAMSSGKPNRSLGSLFGELSPVEAVEGENTTLFVNLTGAEEMDASLLAEKTVDDSPNHRNDITSNDSQSHFDIANNNSMSFSAALDMESIDGAASVVAEAAAAFNSAAPETALPVVESSTGCDDSYHEECDTTGTTTVASMSMSMMVTEEKCESSPLELESGASITGTSVDVSPAAFDEVAPEVEENVVVEVNSLKSVVSETLEHDSVEQTITAPIVEENVFDDKAAAVESVVEHVDVAAPSDVVDLVAESAVPAPATIVDNQIPPVAAISAGTDYEADLVKDSAAVVGVVPDILSPSLVLEKQLAELKAARQAEKDRIMANKQKRLEKRDSKLAMAVDAHNRSNESMTRFSPSTGLKSSSGSSKYDGSSPAMSADSRDNSAAAGPASVESVEMVLEGLNLSAELEPEAVTDSTSSTAYSQPTTPPPPATSSVASNAAERCCEEPVNVATMSTAVNAVVVPEDEVKKEADKVVFEETVESRQTESSDVAGGAVTDVKGPDEAAFEETVESRPPVISREKSDRIDVIPPPATPSVGSVKPSDAPASSPFIEFIQQISQFWTPKGKDEEVVDAATLQREDAEQQDILMRSVENTDYIDVPHHSTPKTTDNQGSIFRFACVVPGFPVD